MDSYDHSVANLRGEGPIGPTPMILGAEDDRERDGAATISAAEARGVGKDGWNELFRYDPNPAHVTAFTLDLSMMLKGGLTLNEGLQVLGDTGAQAWLRRLIAQIRQDLAVGRSFSTVLADHPRIFPALYVQTVAVAESSGRLADALEDLAAERARSELLRGKLFSAVAYPAFLLAASIATLCFVLLYVIPQFEGALEGFQDKLSPSTQLVFSMSRRFRDAAPAIAILFAATLAAGLVAIRVKALNLWIIDLIGRLPVANAIVQQQAVISFCRTLATLLANGVAVTAALRLARDVVGSKARRSAIDLAIADIRGGERLSAALAARAVLPPAVTQMMRAGEEAGRIADSANRIAAMYESRLDTTLARFAAIIGPVTMIAVAFLIAWLIVSVMTALVSINDVVV